MTVWAEIPGFDGLYRVSKNGIVQSCHKKGSGQGERAEWWNLSRPLDRSGYELVYLWDKNAKIGKQRVRRLVHQLVAESFLPARPKGRDCVNHIDGNKQNNNFRNLEWRSRAGNMRHAWKTGLCKPHKLTEKDVREILHCGGTDTETAVRFGVSQVMITRIRARKAWTHVD